MKKLLAAAVVGATCALSTGSAFCRDYGEELCLG